LNNTVYCPSCGASLCAGGDGLYAHRQDDVGYCDIGEGWRTLADMEACVDGQDDDYYDGGYEGHNRDYDDDPEDLPL
jgi:hypothetical protein